MSSNAYQDPNGEEVERQQHQPQVKKRIVLRKISAKPAPKKTSPKRSTTTDDVAALPAESNNRGQNDDDDEEQPEQQQAPAPRPTRKAASPKPQAKRSTTATRSAEQREFDAAVAFLYATAPSNAQIITANAVAAVEVMERKEAEEQQRRRQAEEELERQKKQQQEQAAAASSSSTSSEPLLSCSECHQQMPKSEFSSSQAKKLVGRKCKQCVVKVVEIEAQLREEAAVNAVLEKMNSILQKINELPQLEQAQRLIIAEEEAAAFVGALFDRPFVAYARELARIVGAFLRTRKWPEYNDPRRPVFHKWFFSMESNDDSMIASSPHSAPFLNKEAAALLLRDKGWTLVGAFERLAMYTSDAEDSKMSNSLMQSEVCVTMRLVNSLIDAGALAMLPQPWCNEHNPMHQIKLLFRDTFQRMNLVEENVRTMQSHRVCLFGARFTGVELVLCIQRILQRSQTVTATEEDVVEFLRFLVDVNVAAAYFCRAVLGAGTINDLIRFLFIPAPDDQPCRCFIARLLRNDNSIPDRISQLLCVLIAQCRLPDFSVVRWFELVADLVCGADPSVVSVMLSPPASQETGKGSKKQAKAPTVTVSALFVDVNRVPREFKVQVAAHLSRTLTTLSRSMQTSDDPVFNERARSMITCLQRVTTTAHSSPGNDDGDFFIGRLLDV